MIDAKLQQDLINSLKLVKTSYPDCPNLAVEVERVCRNETEHFKSIGFLRSLSCGMEAFAPDYPYGWSNLREFWDNYNQYIPAGTIPMVENNSAEMASRGSRNFIKFVDTDSSLMSVAEVLYQRRDKATKKADAGEWFSFRTDAVGIAARAKYDSVTNNITPHICIDNGLV